MNILNKLKAILLLPNVKLGFMPDKPDSVIALFEYEGKPPEHYFGGMDNIQNVQVRVRDITTAKAFASATAVSQVLNRYADDEVSILQSTQILDIGYDNANPQRQEYTINFTVRRL